MKVDVLLGLQWGDEGKGKVVDVLTPKYDVIARFQGGPNAGHTLEFEGSKHVLHTIPSGIFHSNKINVIGNGVVIDPVVFKREIDALLVKGVDVKKNLRVSRKAHLILPTHRLLDAASEASKGKEKIGSTLKGIGPTYMDKTGRNGLRVGDIFSPNFFLYTLFWSANPSVPTYNQLFLGRAITLFSNTVFSFCSPPIAFLVPLISCIFSLFSGVM
jgi:adenylosuccinate synthase